MPSRNWSSLTTISIVAFFTMIGLRLGNLFQPLYLDNLDIVQNEISLLFFFCNVVSGIIRIPIGVASDKYGQKMFIAISAICFALSGCLFSIFESFETLTIPFMLWGIGCGLYYTTSWTYIADLTTSDGRIKTYGIIALFQTIGMGIGPFIGGFIANKFGIKTIFTLMSIIYFFVAIISLKLRKVGRRRREQQVKFKENLKILKKNKVGRLLKTFSILYFIRGLYMGISIPSLPLFLRKIHGLDYSQIGLITATTAIGSAIGYYSCTHLPDNTDLKNVMTYSSLFNAFVIIIFLMTNSPIIFGVASMLLGFIMTFGLTGPGSGPISSTLFLHGLPPSTRGFASGMVGTLWRAGLSLGSLIMASIWTAFGIGSVFYLFATLFAIEVIVIMLGISSKKREDK